MRTIQDMTFETISKRALYGLRLFYSDFSPTESSSASAQEQKRLHEIMGILVDKLNDDPSLLNLPDDKDEAYQAWEVNNMKPGLDKVYQTIFKSLFEFYKFLYMAALHGKIESGCLTVGSAELKAHKAAYRPLYKTLLYEAGIEISSDKAGVSICADVGVLKSIQLLAGKVPVNVNKWTPFVLANFACCSFTGDFSYLLQRTDDANNMDGLLFTMQKEALSKGYVLTVSCEMTATYIGITISFNNGVGGFQIGYNPRKYKPFYFGTANGIGEKAMLDDFDNLDGDLKEHLVKTCKPCNGCLTCTKNGKNKIYTTIVTHNGTEYKLCPSFPWHRWDAYDRGLIDSLYKYHGAQNVYGVDWKK